MPTILSKEVRFRFEEAHRKYQMANFPEAVKAGGYIITTYPDCRTSNGLTNFVIKFLKWNAHYANRINVMGRMVDGVEKTESGALIGTKKFIKSTTRKGTADINAIINGRPVSIEIKVGKDKMSSDQIKEKLLIEKAGGTYIVVKTPEDFILWYDQFMLNLR